MQATYDHKLLIIMHSGSNTHSACVTNKYAQEKKKTWSKESDSIPMSLLHITFSEKHASLNE